MGNRAVITGKTTSLEVDKNAIGVYLHWNGGRDSVEAFLTYCKLRGDRSPEKDNYGWARLCQVIGNYFGGTDSIGIGTCGHLDCDNWDNGVYFIENWEIVGRAYMHHGSEQKSHNLKGMLIEINDAQPMRERLQREQIEKFFEQGE